MRTFGAFWIHLHNAPLFMKQPGMSVNYFDSQALTSPAPNMNGFEFAALYTLQHRLAREAKFHRGFQHRQIPRRRTVQKLDFSESTVT